MAMHFSSTYKANVHAISTFCVGSTSTVVGGIDGNFLTLFLGVRRLACGFCNCERWRTDLPK